jgi:hypothetical protein
MKRGRYKTKKENIIKLKKYIKKINNGKFNWKFDK